ncbi:competence type IV pilus minor pilin ComGD [Streptococcus cuniculipharyngis]|uniref:Type II secretion system protein n=2 Tax=Streptococcus cuniculipharyngis TaxID=1562651 RepID=A0A5C5SCE2_9STRE|nr:competence type IV pilus minor pilin ComGD [Streptococcus cuniculipharyngis]TWS97370.1 type II secretion system protein [Streptococcus cuniculipharyngis]
MNIIVKIVKKVVKYQIRAFSLLESLWVLLIVSFLIISFSGSVRTTFDRVEEGIFFLSFEQLYRQTQRLSISRQEEMVLSITEHKISNQEETLPIPAGIRPEKDYLIRISRSGGNSSLSRVVFKTAQKSVRYQLYIGSGKYKKSEIGGLYSP